MILPYHGHWPKIHETAFVAPSADIIGEVEIGRTRAFGFSVVIRGDVHRIRIGNQYQYPRSFHASRDSRRRVRSTIGDEVTVGHRVTLHGCTIGNRVLVGMGAIILDDAEIGDECMIGAGALVTKGRKFRPEAWSWVLRQKSFAPLNQKRIGFSPQERGKTM